MDTGDAVKLRDLCRKADLAIRLGATEYAVGLCEHILRTFPNDLLTRTLLGQAHFDQGNVDQACRQFDVVLELDPENVPALSAAGVAHSVAGQLNAAVRAFERAYELNPGNGQVRDSLARLYVQRDGNARALSPAPTVAVIRWRLRHAHLDSALDAVDHYLLSRPGDILVLLARAEALWRAGRREASEQACRQVLARHPRFLKPRLILGQILSSDRRREIEGVEMLHDALVEDPGGLVATALFRDSTFSPPILAADVFVSTPEEILVGPAEIEAAFDVIPISGVESVDLDWRPPDDALDLPVSSGDAASPTENSIGAESYRGAKDVPPADIDCLLAVSCRGPLVARYGFEGFQRLERRLQTVARELAFTGTRLVVVFVDDPGSMAQHELSPVWSTDPTEIKRAIDDLDRVVSRDGKGVDGILIIGGDDIVPFFHLPNPADDDDSFVLSDSPYAIASGGSVYAPEIPVGRLPDGAGDNPNLLLRQIDTLFEVRRKPLVTDSGPRIIQAGLAALGAFGLGNAGSLAFGCSAAAWETVAGVAFEPIAPASHVRASPPTTADVFNPQLLAGRRFLYFSLHGVQESAVWYGQGFDEQSDDGAIFPLALTPDQLSEVYLGAPVIFAQVSFAGHILAKSASNSFALRFLNEGAASFVGPTGLCYGRTEPPLAGADLLSHFFWKNLRDGDRVGVALQRAKRQYVRDVLESQGYLDGDDQKTLLQFVLYGDPLMPVFRPDQDADDELDASSLGPSVLICNRTGQGSAVGSTSPRFLRKAMEHLVQVCPEVSGGTIRVRRRGLCCGLCDHPAHQGTGGAASPERPGIVVVTARRELSTLDGANLVKIGRITLDEDGGLLKFVVSR